MSAGASRAKWPTISSDGSLLVTAWGDAEPESGPPLTPVFLHTWNGSAYTARLSINYTIAQAPSSPIAISPDGAFIAIPSVRSDERAGGALQSYLELRGLRLPEQSRSGPALTVLECSFFVPGLVNPLSSANLATGVMDAWVSSQARQSALMPRQLHASNADDHAVASAAMPHTVQVCQS